MDAQEIFTRLFEMRQRIERDCDEPLTEGENAILWDVARNLGLSEEQAAILAGDPATPEPAQLKLQRQLSNGAWVDDDRVEHFLDLVLEREPWYAPRVKREPMTTRQEVIDFLATGKAIHYDSDWYAQIRDGGVYEQREELARQSRANDPNFSNAGWLMDCGHRVHFKAEIMQAGHGTSCQHCYDRMSN